MVKETTLENVISLSEIKKHTKRDDCWLIIGGVVYDLTKFLSDHPGGSDVILQCAGRDGTEDFRDIGHGPQARKMADAYELGVVEGHEGPIIGCESPEMPPNTESRSMASMVFVLLIVFLSIAVYYFKDSLSLPF